MRRLIEDACAVLLLGLCFAVVILFLTVISESFS